LHVQPGARRTQVAGIHGAALKLRLAAPPVDGKANAALRAFLADAFGVPLRQVTLLRGETSRDKAVRVEAPTLRPDREWASARSGPGTADVRKVFGQAHEVGH
jgi:uncharacterized protein (TIGR00251 family)